MGKKDKSKFKKQIRTQLLQEVAQAQSQMQTTQTAQFPDKSKMAVKKNILDTNAPLATAAILPNSEFDLKQIKYDLKKTGIVVFALAATIVALYYLDLKYGILLHFGNWLFKILNIK